MELIDPSTGVVFDHHPISGRAGIAARAAINMRNQVILAGLLDAFEPLYDDFERRGPAGAVAAFTEYAAFPDRCRVDDRLDGVALGVDPDGALRLRDDAGQIHRVISGEVQP